MSATKGDELVASLVPGYHSLSLLHRGEGAVIYHALREDTDVPAALKVLRVEDPGFAPDLTVASRVSAHPQVVGVLGTGTTTTGRPYIAMDYCPGGSYADRLATTGPLPVDEVLKVGKAIAAALSAAHAEGLLHLGIKPGNILLGERGPVLADFRPTGSPGLGLASEHAAPEALEGHEQSPASDVYGLASTLWTLLAGRPPFATSDPLDYRDRALSEPAPPVPRSDIPRHLQRALARGMAKAPALRYATAEDFATALTPSAAPPPTPHPDGTADPNGTARPDQELPGWSFFDSEPELTPPTPLARTRDTGPPVPDPAPPPPAPGPEMAWQHLAGWSSTDPEPAPTQEHPLEPGAVPPGHQGPPVPPNGPRRSHSAYVSAAIAGIALGAVVAGVLALGAGSAPADPASPRPSQAAAGAVPTGVPGKARTVPRSAPEMVRLVDGQVIAVLSWRDRSAGKAAHYVIGGPVGKTPTTMAEVPAGKAAKAEVTGLNPTVNYCFIVVAVLAVDQVSPAKPVCTKRKTS